MVRALQPFLLVCFHCPQFLYGPHDFTTPFCGCSVKAAVDAAVMSGTMAAEAGDRLVGVYLRRMRGYTYMV